MPGALPQPSVASPKPFVFGPTGDARVTQANFSEAAQAVLREMNAKLPEHARKLDGELLKGKKAEMKRLVSVNDKLGEGGWGLKTSAAGKDRFAEAHEREFAKYVHMHPRPKRRGFHNNALTNVRRMASISASSSTKPRTLNMPSAAPGETETETAESKIKRKFSDEIVAGPSAPNGAPLVPVDSRATKRSRLSIGPNYLGTLREAGKSLANMLADADGKPANPSLAKKMKEKRDRRRSSLIKSKGEKLASVRVSWQMADDGARPSHFQQVWVPESQQEASPRNELGRFNDEGILHNSPASPQELRRKPRHRPGGRVVHHQERHHRRTSPLCGAHQPGEAGASAAVRSAADIIPRAGSAA
jgi:hypothetical protein